jgi:hypothetical protein
MDRALPRRRPAGLDGLPSVRHRWLPAKSRLSCWLVAFSRGVISEWSRVRRGATPSLATSNRDLVRQRFRHATGFLARLLSLRSQRGSRSNRGRWPVLEVASCRDLARRSHSSGNRARQVGWAGFRSPDHRLVPGPPNRAAVSTRNRSRRWDESRARLDVRGCDRAVFQRVLQPVPWQATPGG